MTIRRSALVLSIAALLTPMTVSAAGGVIRFSGSIVEPTRCQASRVPAAGQGMHRVSCMPTPGRQPAANDSVVKVSTKALRPLPGGPGGVAVPHRLVTLDYL
ncbi:MULTISPECIES: hypothetical protein [Achromobacter]|uniref:Type 1 fimbrial protein n=1 Tax=Achromobacter spanius TaxID=217203 RepID=A0ABY8GX89_9BURK|nr:MULTISPECIES: hypothetical protein [Achromobacter]WAI81292.1 hypothetical protein N8Z00_17270 [Achromobacter spanius]WEX96810.1 hypothetical protein N3Z32_11875 [Achromobacter sp. SS2-2022]WFP09475.1 hypothetical protein P8T11_06235 [Achromobacter spanius]